MSSSRRQTANHKRRQPDRTDPPAPLDLRVNVMTSHRSHSRVTTRSNPQSARRQRPSGRRQTVRPASAHQHRGDGLAAGRAFDAPEIWHEPARTEDAESKAALKVVIQSAGTGYIHPVTADDVRERVLQLPAEFQWGSAVYLYPIEESLAEVYVRAPRPAQRIESEMYGGRWVQDGPLWRLIWTENTIRDFYLNNVLIHEIGHINDQRNTTFRKREQFADWFAIEYGYRASRSRSRSTSNL